MDKLNKNNTLLLVFFISIIALISAYFIEYILGHQPCNLCLIERIPYALSIIIIFLIYKFKQFEKILIMLLILVFVFSFIVSIYHFGIEQGYIKESLVCDLQNGSKILSKDELLKELQKKTVSCKDVTFKLFGLSLTTFNIFISLLITGILAKNFLNYEKINNNKVEEFIRVDHAGERGAVKIYEGQLLALNTLVKDESLKKTIRGNESS